MVKPDKTKRRALISMNILMLLFGIVQVNDPDPALWISIYFGIAIIGTTVLNRKVPNVMLLIIITLVLIFASSFLPDLFIWIQDGFPSITGKMANARPYTELMREFFGLLISALILIYIHRYNNRKTNNI